MHDIDGPQLTEFIPLIVGEGPFCGHHLGVAPRATTTSPDLAVPPGSALLTKPSPLLTMLGPVHAKGMGASMVIGFHVQHYHLNRCGILHGGAVASLADAALGYCLVEPGEGAGGALAMSTASLTVDFIASIGEGDWIEIIPEGLRTGGKLVFVQALFHRGDWPTTRASAVFVVLGGHV